MQATMTVERSVEERLREATERYRLVSDVLHLQSEARQLAADAWLSSDGCLALRALCEASADDLERLARELPPEIANAAFGPTGAGHGEAGDHVVRGA